MEELQFCGDVQRSLRISNTKLAATATAIIRQESPFIKLDVEVKSQSLLQASNTSHLQTSKLKMKNNSPASNLQRKPPKDVVERTDTDKKYLKKVTTIPMQVEQRTSVPWVVCRRVPVSSCARDLQRFFTGLNTLHVCVSTGEIGSHSVVETVDVFIEFDRCAGAELAVIRSGEELRSEKNSHVSTPLQIAFITEEDSIWAKHLGLVMHGSVSIRDRLQILQSLLPAKYLLVDVFKVSSEWSPITHSMTHFHRRSQAVGWKRKAQSVNGTDTIPTEASTKNLRNRFQHLQGNILLDEIFLDDFIFSMEILPSATTVTGTNNGGSSRSSSNNSGINSNSSSSSSSSSSSGKVCPSLNYSPHADTMMGTVVSRLRDLIPLQDSLRSVSFAQSEPVTSKGSVGNDISMDNILLAIDQLSRWIRIYKVVLGELWSIRYTYSAGFTSELVLPSIDKKKKKQKQQLILE